jgi:asparagine synthase (glutamine-hydrolysing)
MNGILPAEVQWRKDKSNLSAGIALGLIKFDRETLDRVILREPEVIRDYVDVPALEAAYLRYLERPMENPDEGFSIQLIVNMALWLGHTKQSFDKNYHNERLAFSLIA